MKPIFLAVALLVVILSSEKVAFAEGFSLGKLWPLGGNKAATTKSKSSSMAFSLQKRPSFSKPKPFSSTARRSSRQPSAWSRLARGTKSMWAKTTETLSFSRDSTPAPKQGPRTVSEWLKQPRLDP